MSKKQEYERVGGGSYGIYRPKPKKDNPWPAIFGIGFVVLLIMGACAG